MYASCLDGNLLLYAFLQCQQIVIDRLEHLQQSFETLLQLVKCNQKELEALHAQLAHSAPSEVDILDVSSKSDDDVKKSDENVPHQKVERKIHVHVHVDPIVLYAYMYIIWIHVAAKYWDTYNVHVNSSSRICLP